MDDNYGYVSMDMARRLKEAGVEIETGRYWKVWSGANIQPTLCSVSEYKIDTDPYHPDADPDVLCGKALYLPAPSMAELVNWFPESYKLLPHIVGYLGEYIPSLLPIEIIELFRNTDALGELALWLKTNNKRK